ncbi:DUF4166 domain-containing protein [Brevibacterium sp. GP-SGM9]|uniref:DUF4166 domain-containing protein n=1 Tax=Brevibacterium sp. GP-SGM9 TaxID=3376990 RepID=UPI0039A43760
MTESPDEWTLEPPDERALESPYERALGARRSRLHPVLQRYFAAVPAGSVGIGEGVFECFGTRHRWLWPALAVLGRAHVIAPGMHRQVPFRVENRTVDGEQTATRTLDLGGRSWSMRDAVHLGRGGRVVDVLGRPALVEASFDVAVTKDHLSLSSAEVILRLGRLRLPVPGPLRPGIRLSEHFDDGEERQRIELTVDMPVLGRVYEYRGWFTYEIRPEAGTSDHGHR